MNILFWNLRKNPIEKYITEIIRERDIDIAIFAEYDGITFKKVVDLLEGSYAFCEGNGACEKITLLHKNTIPVSVRREQSRYTIYECEVSGIRYNLIGTHLPAPPLADAARRMNVIRAMVGDIEEQEKTIKNYNTIVIGDFNCNPFEKEVIQKDSFNAVLFKPVIKDQELIEYEGSKYRRFYNPIIDYLSEKTQTYGSIYCSSGSIQLYWNSFDQILVRKALVDNITSLEYVKRIGLTSLVSKMKPKGTISDHLPLVVGIR